MKHVLILRALGVVLAIALAVNITAVLAAPLYLHSSDQLAQPSSTDQQKRQPTESAAADPDANTPSNNLIVIDGDVVQSDSTAEPDSSDPSLEASPEPHFSASVQSESERVFFDLGVRIGSRSEQPVASVIRRFLRPATIPDEEEDSDLLPTVVITGADVEQPNETEDLVDVDVPTHSGIEHIVLENPVENGFAVRFQLDGAVQTLNPGALLIETTNKRVIRFDRGGSFGEFQQDLGPGRYQFRVSKEGWNLETAKDDSTL